MAGKISSSSSEFVQHLALAGHGVILAPSFSVGTAIAEQRLIPLLTDWRTRVLPIHVLYPHRPLLSAKVRTFVDFLAARLAPAPD